MKTTLLDGESFLATFAAPMLDVTSDATNVIDIWPYVESVPPKHLRGHEVYDHFVEYVYRDATGRFDHVQVMTKTKDVYLTVVVNLKDDVIHGHHLLDLNEKYGLPTARDNQPLQRTGAAAIVAGIWKWLGRGPGR